MLATCALACACEELGAAGGAKAPEAAPDAGAPSACPPPRTASADASVYQRLTAGPWCSVRFLGADERAPRGRLELATDGQAIFHTDASGPASAGGPAWASAPDRPRSGCWRLEGRELQGSDDGRTFTAVPYELDDTEPPTLRLRGAVLSPCP